MPANNQIQYLPNAAIDKKKWNATIDVSPNGLIYAYSFYLDTMAKHWDALVLGDYQAVMPLTWNKKYGLYYLYQPAFTASLGVFGKNLTEQLITEFIKAIPEKYKLIEISLNSGNIFSTKHGFTNLRSNYFLNLNKPYQDISASYRENHKRNINKAFQSGCTISRQVSVDAIISLNRELLKNVSGTRPEDYIHFKELFKILKQQDKAETYGILGKNGQLFSSGVFFYSHNRAYYILVGNHPDGKTIGASHALIDAFIKDHAGQDLILDFEGSDIRNLAFFYSGFGAQEEVYPAFNINKLPAIIRWLKK